ncbi:tetratricopeptide repeat protein [Aeoliella mucimassa]|uniref:Photosystem I assembly protein Ycf3 n=1 Tax=Aeoliella mucimassa TaxID=2527972 RepID=A0A518ARG7_9BACT|nr:tetratricopeptide repeat protein [Aeoliella mucimassa]QDU57317.1 Photosystem I assembly protein Ycf3 [Aeoliella mucimassa]
MRKVILTSSLLAAITCPAWGGMPVLHSSSTEQPATAVQPKEKTHWWSRMWKSEPEKSEPTFFYRPPVEEPSTTERITTAMTDNAAVRAAKSWVTPNKDEAPQQVDPLSLAKPTGKPTPELMRMMAQTREGQQDIAGAREMYMKALAANPRSVKTLRALGHFEDRQNKLLDAERYYTQAVQIEPENPALLNDLALCLARQEKMLPSVQVLERAIALAPTKPLYRNNLATVLMELGDQQHAMQHLMAVHSQPAAYYNMAHLLEKRGQQEAALAHYAEALRLDPSMQPAELAVARLSNMADQQVAQVSPETTQQVAQTAMAPADSEQQQIEMPQIEWPSEPIQLPTGTSNANEPSFGPQLFPAGQ